MTIFSRQSRMKAMQLLLELTLKAQARTSRSMTGPPRTVFIRAQTHAVYARWLEAQVHHYGKDAVRYKTRTSAVITIEEREYRCYFAENATHLRPCRGSEVAVLTVGPLTWPRQDLDEFYELIDRYAWPYGYSLEVLDKFHPKSVWRTDADAD